MEIIENFLSQQSLMELDSKLCQKDGDIGFKELKDFKSDLLEANRWYAITISPDDHHQFYDHPDRPSMFENHIKKYVNKLKSSNRIALFLETSNPNDQRKNRLHVHGVISFSPIGIAKWYMFHRNLIVKSNMVKVHGIQNPITWRNYCEKDKVTMMYMKDYYQIQYPYVNCYNTWEKYVEPLEKMDTHKLDPTPEYIRA